MTRIVKENKAAFYVEVAHNYTAGGGDIQVGKTTVRIPKALLEMTGLSAEEQAKNHIQTSTRNFHSFLGE